MNSITPFPLQTLPHEMILAIGCKMGVAELKALGTTSKQMREFSRLALMSKPAQANQILQRLLAVCPSVHETLLPKWIEATSPSTPLRLRLSPKSDLPLSIVKLLDERFKGNLTLSLTVSDLELAKKVCKCCPEARLALNFQNPSTSLLNKLFQKIPNIKELVLDCDFSKIKWPKNLESLSCRIRRSDLFKYLPSSLLKLSCEDYTGDWDFDLNSCMPQLQELELVRWQIKGEQMALLPTSLVKLKCVGCNLGKINLSSLSHLQHLKELDLLSTELTTGLFAFLPTSLVRLNCCCGPLNDSALAYLSRLTQLEELNINCEKIKTGKAFAHLPRSLKRLHSSYCGLNDAYLLRISHLTRLREIRVCGFYAVKEETVTRLPPSLSTIECVKINPSASGLFQKHHPNLKVVQAPSIW